VAGNRLIKTMLEPLEWFYPSAKALHMWRLRREFNTHSEDPILILQMGKVGSKSVEAGLDALEMNRSIYHAHFLSRERTAETELQRRKFFRTERQSYLQRPWLNQFILQTFEETRDTRRWKLITLTREPVARNISAFFENLEVVPCDTDGGFEVSSDYYQIEPTVVSVGDLSDLEKMFFERARHDSPVKFFDREIKDIFGIDVLASGFSTEKGYEIYSSSKADLLVLRLESLADCSRDAFAEFLGIDDFQIINRNIGTEKVYASLYSAFKRGAAFDSDYVNTLYNSDYMKTFYSGAEIDAARARWQMKAADSVV
jgi:hypothetical protein